MQDQNDGYTDIHPLLGPTSAIEDTNHDPAPPESESQERDLLGVGPVTESEPKVYCESCGYVSYSHMPQHAPGCPQEAAVALEAEEIVDSIDDPDETPSTNEPEPIRPLVRRIAASILRRVARKLDSGR